MNFRCKFTFFTPIFNRKDTIHRVWDSLNNQTFRDFEWIIVDDGSSDNVIELLIDYKTKALFPLTIIQQSNLGKHFAWNKAVHLAKGEFFIPADSDDAFVPETLERFIYFWQNIPVNERKQFSGINCLCKDPETGNIIGNKFLKSPLISDNLELYYKYKIRGEKWGCVRTDILINYPFPEIEGRGCYNLGYAWNSIARKYKNVSINEALRYYYSDSSNTITKNLSKKIIETAPVDFHYLKWDLNNNLDYKFRYGYFISTLKSILNLWRISLLLGEKMPNTIKEMKGFARLFTILLLVPGFLIYKITFKKYKNILLR